MIYLTQRKTQIVLKLWLAVKENCIDQNSFSHPSTCNPGAPAFRTPGSSLPADSAGSKDHAVGRQLRAAGRERPRTAFRLGLRGSHPRESRRKKLIVEGFTRWLMNRTAREPKLHCVIAENLHVSKEKKLLFLFIWCHASKPAFHSVILRAE